jgi:hypothetical protein
MGGERFDTPQPEAYLFGENADLNFLGSRPTPVRPFFISYVRAANYQHSFINNLIIIIIIIIIIIRKY